MKKRNYLQPALCLILSCCILWIQCSYIGYQIGGSSGAEKEIVNIAVWEIHQIQPGTILEIQLLDNSILRGMYEEVDLCPQYLYIEKYKMYQEQYSNSQILPNLNDSITVYFTSDSIENCQLKGFDCDIYEDSSEYSIIVRRQNQSVDSNYTLNSITGFLDKRGQFFKADQISNFIQEGIIPVKSSILIEDFTKNYYVSLSEVCQITAPKVKRDEISAAVFGLMGAIIDGLLIWLIVSEPLGDFDIDITVNTGT